MRKRSEVAAAPHGEQAPAKMQQQTIPGTDPPAPKSEPRPKADAATTHYVARPDGSPITGVTFDRGIYFATCPECELNLSIESGRTATGFACIRCGANLDPKGDFPFLPRVGKAPKIDKQAGPAVLDGEQTDATGERAKAIAEEVARVQVNDARAAAANPTKCCDVCGAVLTVTTLGLFYPCGHDKRPAGVKVAPDHKAHKLTDAEKAGAVAPATKEMKIDPRPPKKDMPTYDEAIKQHRESEAAKNAGGLIEVVSVVHGAETFTPRPYNTFVVGPFTMTTSIRPNETPEEAVDRASRHLEDQAEREFKRKADLFLQKLSWLVSKVGDK